MEKLVEISPWAFDTILDSKHIVATNILKIYDIKLINCGDYTQVYIYDHKKSKKHKREKNSDLELVISSKPDKEDKPKRVLSSEISKRSILRSKLECQRIAKSNINDWESFITLTFEKNVKDIDFANKRLKNYIDKIRRVKKDFKYICIPEFQDRGAVHYHLLTNIKCNTELIPKRPTKKTFNSKTNRYKNLKYYDLKYWFDGFSSAEPLKGDIKKIIGYISKYMTKDIDNRLFNRHKYFYSRNLKTPADSYVDADNKEEIAFYKKTIQESTLVYQNTYKNPYDNTKVIFLEYLK